MEMQNGELSVFVAGLQVMECWMLHQWLSHFLPLLSRSQALRGPEGSQGEDKTVHPTIWDSNSQHLWTWAICQTSLGLFCTCYFLFSRSLRLVDVYHPHFTDEESISEKWETSVTQLLVELGFTPTFQDSTAHSLPSVLCGLSRTASILEDGWQREGSWEWVLQGSLWDLKFRKMIGLPIRQQWKLFSRLYTWTSPDGQHRNQIDYILCSQRWRSSIESAKTRPGADCGSDHELLIPNSDLNWRT